jgi:hypothetical protein
LIESLGNEMKQITAGGNAMITISGDYLRQNRQIKAGVNVMITISGDFLRKVS